MVKNGGLRTKGVRKQSSPDRPLVSIITVVLNGERFLAECIQSVISQDYDNLEYIIVDGGSRDGTLDIIRHYEDRIDYWLSEPDEGLYDALNKGVKLSNGDIFSALHADDAYYNQTVINRVATEFMS